MSPNQLDKKIAELLSADNKVVKKDPITFYWSRKDPNLLLNILDTFCDSNEVIYDPFLGSAPILYSIDASKKNLSFIGSEINEMPISFMKFNLKTIEQSEIRKLQDKFLNFYEKHIHLYQYKDKAHSEEVTLSKLIFDKSEGNVLAKEFIFTNKSKLTASDALAFDALKKTYDERFSRLSKQIQNEDVNLITNSRIAIKDGMKLSNLFNPINYYVLKEYSKEFKNDKLMLNILSSTLHLCRLTDLKSQSQFPYWVPTKDIVERNVLLVIQKKLLDVIRNKELNTLNLQLADKFEDLQKSNKGVLIINKPSQLITTDDIPNGSVDLVITDPPYFDQVAYSEYLKIWEHICHLEANLDGEIILSNRKVNPSTEEQYLDNLTKCFRVVSDKLKDNGLAIIFFKDSKPNNIYLFLKAMENSSFSFIRSVHIGNKKFTYKQNTTQDTTVGGECLFFFKKDKLAKPTNNEVEKLTKDELVRKIEKVVVNFATTYLEANQRASLGELYDNGLMLSLYKNNLLQKINNAKLVVDILNEKFNLQNDRNYTID